MLVKLNKKAVTQIYLVANTPTYLFRHLRSEQSVKDLANHWPSQTLLEQVATIDAQAKRSEVDIAIAYAALVAATYRDPREVAEARASVKIKNLSWVDDILAIWFDSATPESSVLFTAQPRQAEQFQISDATSSTTVIDEAPND